MSKETVYHGRQDDVHSVHSMYEVTERDKNTKTGMEGLVGGLCTIAMLLEYTNVVLSSHRENKDHPIDYEMGVSRVLPVRQCVMLMPMLMFVQLHLIGSQAIIGDHHLQSPLSMLLFNTGMHRRSSTLPRILSS